MTGFLSKSRNGLDPPPYSCSAVLLLPLAASNTVVVRLARAAWKRLWHLGQHYSKGGVLFDSLEPAGQTQLALFGAVAVSAKPEQGGGWPCSGKAPVADPAYETSWS
ncbi:hypothetical protein H8B13_19675 [Hymenobacter sp. BT188]|nr:hypothetical protein [Hymenobacter sp. BT188]MBC6609048.1 hypothetical protein [Hymenobacter sp. BT188]